MAQGWLYDGTSAIRHEVALEAAGENLIVRYADGDCSEIPRPRLFHLDTRGDFEVYGHQGVDGWRLGIPRGAAEELGPLLPPQRRYGRWIDRIGLWRAAAAAALISAGLVFGATRFPGWVAPMIPKSWERSIGGPVLAGLEGRYCHGPGGDAALRKLAHALAPEAEALDIRVVNIGMVNAAALPGDRILIFEELIRRAEGPEEVAGVLAHEIAHVQNRHVTEAMVRQLSFGLLVSLFGGGTGANLETFLSTRYTRGAEEEADRDAIRALERARISPAGAAAFFGRVARQEGRLGVVGRGLSYFSTHPESAERERRFRERAGSRTDWVSPLTPEEWKALVAICRSDPEQNGD